MNRAASDGWTSGRWAAWAVDAVVAAFSTGAAVVLHREVASGMPPGGAARAALAAAAIHGASTLFRRRHPVAVLATIVVTAAMTAALGFPVFMLGPAVLFGMYSAGATLPGRRSATVAAIVTASVAALVALGPGYPGPASTLFYSVLAAAAWWLGHLVQRSRTAAAEHARRADELAATREELARYAVSEERRRIARELHDVVAHSMTVVAMHAGAGRMVASRDPAAAVEALSTVERLSREALGEMRRLVGLLRAGGEEEEQLAPAPGLGELHRLVAEVVGAGMAVEVKTAGDLESVPPGPALTAYRILQEALTNAVRHSGAGRAEVSVEVSEAELAVRITNGPGAGAAGPGRDGGGMGMVGMRERVALYDGSLSAGPLPDGGYRVEARIPLGKGTG